VGFGESLGDMAKVCNQAFIRVRVFRHRRPPAQDDEERAAESSFTLQVG